MECLGQVWKAWVEIFLIIHHLIPVIVEKLFDKHTLKIFMLLKSEINLLAEIQRFLLWDIPENSFHYSIDKKEIFLVITYTDKTRRLRWKPVKKHFGYLNQMLLNSGITGLRNAGLCWESVKLHD